MRINNGKTWYDSELPCKALLISAAVIGQATPVPDLATKKLQGAATGFTVAVQDIY